MMAWHPTMMKLFFLRCILSYVLEDPAERVRLKIEFLPPLWPSHTCKAPVPWHQSYTRATEALFYRFYEGNPIILELKRIWFDRWWKMYICDMDKMQEGLPFPQYPGEFTERLNKLCADFRTDLVENWLIEVADTMIKMRRFWQPFVAKNRKESLFQVEEFFKCIHGLMSKQIRDLVERSVQHFADYFSYYFEGNDYEGDQDPKKPYKDYTYIKRPLLRIKVVGHPGTNNLTFDPSLEQVRVMIVKWFHTIINVNYQLPSVDRMLYPDTPRPQPNLLCVYPDEPYMTDTINKSANFFKLNRPGPMAFLNRYEKYHYILDGQAYDSLMAFFAQEPPPYLKLNRPGPVNFLNRYEKYHYILDGQAYDSLMASFAQEPPPYLKAYDSLMAFFAQEPKPYLKDFSARIYHYERLRDEITFLRRDIPLNMIMLDCAPVNDLLWDIVNGLRTYIVDHYVLVNRKWNRA
ncbi:dynein heavy chain 3, axonemal [Phthorimaea operculella]|nr:dynein heavy chain 3, axonemal [Phthorimaea operculella]